MAAKSLFTPEQYLRMSFDGADRELVDGELVERNLAENPDSKAQWRLSGLFFVLAREKKLHARPELRVRVRPDRYRIVDLAVFAGEEPAEPVPTTPPLIAIEIVSRDDRHTEIMEKLEEYRAWGVAHVWLVDPWFRRLYVHGENDLTEVKAYRVPELGAEIPADEIL